MAKKYLIYCLASLIALSGLYYALFILQFDNGTSAEYWIYKEMILKKQFAEQIKTPKIIIISGSNALFGVDSHLLAAKSHKPVVNLAIHAGLPLDDILNFATEVADRSDVIILPLEWEYYSGNFLHPSEWTIQQVVAWNKAYFYALPWFR